MALSASAFGQEPTPSEASGPAQEPTPSEASVAVQEPAPPDASALTQEPTPPDASALAQEPTSVEAPANASTSAKQWDDDPYDAAVFGDPAVSEPRPSHDEEDRCNLSASAFFRSQLGFWSERLREDPLAKARQSIDMDVRYRNQFGSGRRAVDLRIVAGAHLEYDFTYLQDRDYDLATEQIYRANLIGGETYLALSGGPVELSLGRQIVVWGYGDMLSPADVVNPRDVREPGLADLEDIRLATLASRLGLFWGKHRLEGMVIHENFFGLIPPPLAPFSPMRQLIFDEPALADMLAGATLRYRHLPERWDFYFQQFLGRWEYNSPRVDLALYAASVFDRTGVPRLPGSPVSGTGTIIVDLDHPRYTLLGHAGRTPIGGFVLRWEVIAELDRPLITTQGPSQLNLGMVRRDQLTGMLGATYSAANTRVMLEYQQSYVINNPDRDTDSVRLLMPADLPRLAARYTVAFLRDRLHVGVLASLLGIRDPLAFFARAELAYDVRDDLELSLGYATYLPSENSFGPFYGFTRHDRLLASLRWDVLFE